MKRLLHAKEDMAGKEPVLILRMRNRFKILIISMSYDTLHFL